MLSKAIFTCTLWLLLLLLACATYSGEAAQFSPFNRTLSDFLGKSPTEPRIVGGQPIAIANAKYQVSLRLKSGEKKYFGGGFICGGSVIAQRVVLTAAHCIYDSNATPPKRRKDSDFTVVMGSELLYIRTATTLQYDAQRIVVHERYNTKTLENDIAMVLLKGQIPWNWSTVQAIPLTTRQVPDDTSCAVSGWGVMSNGQVSSVLNVAYVPIVNELKCSISYQLSAGMLCAGYYRDGGVDACQGDSGGPLNCNGQLTGVVSWGAGCGVQFFPGVYTNTSYYNNWILATNASLNGGCAAHAFGQSQLYALLTCGISLLLTKMLRT